MILNFSAFTEDSDTAKITGDSSISANPIKVEVKTFYDEVLSRYFEVTNDYYVEYEKLRKSRKVHKVLDLNEEGK